MQKLKDYIVTPLPQGKGQIITLHTDNLHLANLLKICDCKLYSFVPTGKRMPQGNEQVMWFFEETGKAKELATLWLKCGEPGFEKQFDWSQFSDLEKQIVITMLACFCDSLKHTIRQAKTATGKV